MPFFKLVPGMSHSIDVGTRRYIEAAGYGLQVSGEFFASKPKKMTSPLVALEMDHLDNPAPQQALW